MCSSDLAKRVLRYLKGKPNDGIVFTKNANCNDLIAYSDSDYAGCPDTRKSRTGYAIFLFGNLISWKSKLQSVIAMSTAEAELIAAVEAAKELVYIQSLLTGIGIDIGKVALHVDNQPCIEILKNGGHFNRAKHIQVRYHFLRGLIEEGKIVLRYVQSKDNVADTFTKPVARQLFEKLNICS